MLALYYSIPHKDSFETKFFLKAYRHLKVKNIDDCKQTYETQAHEELYYVLY